MQSAQMPSSGNTYFSSFLQASKHFLIGDLSFNNELTFTEVYPGIQTLNLGLLSYFLGSYYFVNPNPELKETQEEYAYDISELLNQLDADPKGRSCYQTFNNLTDGIHLLADTGPHAAMVRKVIVRYLGKSNDIVNYANKIFQQTIGDTTEGKEFVTKELVREMVLTILVKLFFNIDKLPYNTSAIMQLFSDVAFSAKSNMLPTLYKFDPTYREAKRKYAAFSQQFLHDQIDVILDTFAKEGTVASENNLIVDLIVEIAKIDNPQLKNDPSKLNAYLKELDRQEILFYLDHELIKSIPSIFITADNISKVIEYSLDCLSLDSTISYNWKVEMKQEYENKFFHKDVSEVSVSELKQLESLSSFYLQCLSTSMDQGNTIVRYSTKEIKLKNNTHQTEMKIPAYSTIQFNLGSAGSVGDYHTSRSILFSAKGHKRACPGFHVAEALFKIIIANLVFRNFDLISEHTDRITLREKHTLPSIVASK